MSLQEILLSGGLGTVVLLSMVQIAPVKFNPWSAIGKAIGRAINGDVLKEVRDTRAELDKHIKLDNERNADLHRTRILQFNNELLRDIPHTREDFIDILEEIDCYESYCKNHQEYKNNRAVHAISNIERVYDERLKKHDFL